MFKITQTGRTGLAIVGKYYGSRVVASYATGNRKSGFQHPTQPPIDERLTCTGCTSALR